jgi:hypothetical protein
MLVGVGAGSVLLVAGLGSAASGISMSSGWFQRFEGTRAATSGPSHLMG